MPLRAVEATRLYRQIADQIVGLIDSGEFSAGSRLPPERELAGLLVLVRTIGMFELTFFTAGPATQTLVVALYYAVFAAGVRAPQSVDAMAMVYMGVTLIWLLIALRFVNPTQLVSRVKEHPQGAL